MRKNLNIRNRESGFTIIEVVLVLAIAGLIFLIVFLALPQLQKSRRDTQRKSDAGRTLAALESYAGNNNGAYPTWGAQFNTFVTQYLTTGGVWQDPSTGATYVVTAAVGTAPTAGAQVQYAPGYICAGQAATNVGAGARDVAVVVYQESGGTACQDNK